MEPMVRWAPKFLCDQEDQYLSSSSNHPPSYREAGTERFIIEHAEELGYAGTDPTHPPSGCLIWSDPSATMNSSLHNDLNTYMKNLEDFNQRVEKFSPTHYNLRKAILNDWRSGKSLNATTGGGCRPKSYAGASREVCSSLRLHPDGMKGIFLETHLVSYTSTSGYIEPLLPPMRHPTFCSRRNYAFWLNYLVHDFEHMCLNSLKPHGRSIFVDMGASLKFSGIAPRVLELLGLYGKFGFRFDHIYAFEHSFVSPEEAFRLVPKEYFSAYHWINVGVNAAEPNSTISPSSSISYLNPLTMILEEFNDDDFIVVKMDIDTPSIEMPLVKQLLAEQRFGRLVDQFYFEHHVLMKEMSHLWGTTDVQGSVKDSLDIFYAARAQGIPSHFWI